MHVSGLQLFDVHTLVNAGFRLMQGRSWLCWTSMSACASRHGSRGASSTPPFADASPLPPLSPACAAGTLVRIFSWSSAPTAQSCLPCLARDCCATATGRDCCSCSVPPVPPPDAPHLAPLILLVARTVCQVKKKMFVHVPGSHKIAAANVVCFWLWVESRRV